MKNFFFQSLQNLCIFFAVYHAHEILGYSNISPKAIGKHQLAFANHSQLQVRVMSFTGISFKNLETEPSKVFLENDGQSIIMRMNYDADKVPLLSFDNLMFNYRFEYMYFQWLEKVPKPFTFRNVTFPGELHMVFYETRAENFIEAIDSKRGIVVLAFGIKVLPVMPSYFKELLEKLKTVRQPNTQVEFNNFYLGYWIDVTTQHYCMHKGAISLLSSQTIVTWLDLQEPIDIPPALVKEFELLENADGKPLIKQFQPIVKDNVQKDIICNHQPYYEEIRVQKNSSNLQSKIRAIIVIITQIVLRLAFEI